MTLPAWMMLVFLLSAGSSVAAMDVNWLTGIVDKINDVVRKDYNIEGQYSLAANIPLNQDANRLSELLRDERNVGATVSKGCVYKSKTLVIAKPYKRRHAELRVLDEMQPLIDNRQENFLLIYTFLSPCGQCTDPDNKLTINNDIRQKVLPNWSNYAFVFKTLYNKPKNAEPIPKDKLIESLQQLGNSGLGLENIYRCFNSQGEFQCHSCSSNGAVSDICVEDNSEPQQGGSGSRSPVRDSRIDRGESSRKRGEDRSSSEDRGKRRKVSRSSSRIGERSSGL